MNANVRGVCKATWRVGAFVAQQSTCANSHYGANAQWQLCMVVEGGVRVCASTWAAMGMHGSVRRSILLIHNGEQANTDAHVWLWDNPQ